jgi:hypothetical protein
MSTTGKLKDRNVNREAEEFFRRLISNEKRRSIQEGSKPAETGTKSRIVGLRDYLLTKA